MMDRDAVWQHGDNLSPGFRCNKEKKGGGATRLKEYLSRRVSNVIHYDMVHPDMQGVDNMIKQNIANLMPYLFLFFLTSLLF